MVWKGWGGEREGEGEGSTHFHHLYTRRGKNGGVGGGGYLVDISVFPIPGVSILFHPILSSPSLPRLPAYYPPDETARRILAVVLSDRA